jgi:hypothetical protein
MHRHRGVGYPPRKGPSLGSRLFCPGPSSLNRPHPPHSQAHHDFTALRLIRAVFAVRERLGDPRVVPGFRCSFLPDMPPSLTPGSSTPTCPEFLMPTLAFAEMRLARHSQLSRNPLHAGYAFRGFTGSLLLQSVRLLAPLHGPDRISPASEGFYIQASDGSVTLPAAGYDYNSNWTPLLAGLSPAGMAASLAAPHPGIHNRDRGSGVASPQRIPCRRKSHSDGKIERPSAVLGRRTGDARRDWLSTGPQSTQ